MNKWTLETTKEFPWPKFPTIIEERKEANSVGEFIEHSYFDMRTDVLTRKITLEKLLTGDAYSSHDDALVTSINLLSNFVEHDMVLRIFKEMQIEFSTLAAILELPSARKTQPNWYKSFASNGSRILQVPETIVDDIRMSINDDIYNLQTNDSEWGGVGYDNEVRYTREDSPILYEELEKLFDNMNVIHAVENYMDNEMILEGVTLHVCKEDDKHWNMTQADKPPTPFENLHFDPKNGMMKCIFYLDKVGIDDGPFSYVMGSNRWDMNPFHKVVAKAISVSNYMENGWRRSQFASLPKSMQYCANIGAFMTGDEDILENKYYTGPELGRGNLIVFDPGGLHRGGIVTDEGMRTNLQIMFRLAHKGKALGFI